MTTSINTGAKVFTTDGKELGSVKEVESNAFLVNAPKQFDYWLQSSIVIAASAERVELSISEADLNNYKMDNANDHNAFREKLADHLDPASVRAQALLRGGRSRI